MLAPERQPDDSSITRVPISLVLEQFQSNYYEESILLSHGVSAIGRLDVGNLVSHMR